MFKKTYKIFFLIFLVLTVSYFNRWIFVFKFEPEYWENYYYTSQWNVPNSKRIISDEGVYRYIGYRLVNGENPFNVDYWVPPMGKYWYGVGAKYLNNPYLISFIIYCLSILLFYLLSKIIFKKENVRWFAVYLWTLNPVIVEQIGQTMLDLPMTLFFLAHVLFLFKYLQCKSIKVLLFAGVFLGLMAGTKPAYFVPMIGLLDWCYIGISSPKKERLKNLISYLLFVIGGYILAYTCYFISHPNPIPWIRLHEKVINFQKNNGGSHDILNIFRTIFIDRYKGFWVGGKEILFESWSVILPLGTILLIKNIFFIKKIIKKDIKIAYLTCFGAGYVLMCLTIDFWPRYLVLLIPVLILLVVNVIQSKQFLLILLLLTYLPWLKYNFFPNKTTTLNKWNETITAKHFRDAYRLLSKDTKQIINEKTWLYQWENEKNKDFKTETVLENNQWKIKIDSL